MTREEFQGYKEKAFEQFCRTLIYRESMNAYRELADQADREIAFSALPANIHQQLSSTDTYQIDQTLFIVRGEKVIIHNDNLGQALRSLPYKQRETLLMRYILGHNDQETAELLHVSVPTVRYRRHQALALLKEILGGFRHE